MEFKNDILLPVFILLFTVSGFTQGKEKMSLWQFHSIYQVGLLQGQTGGAFQMQTIDGVQYRSWFAGVGVGFDYYRLRSIPLFLDLRKEFGQSRNRFFVYADGGINFNWLTDKQKADYTYLGDKYSNGLYTDAGIGYRIGMGSRNALLLAAGYSFKAISSSAYLIDPGFGPDGADQFHYHMNRLSIKAGLEF